MDNNGKILYHPDLRLSVIKWHSIVVFCIVLCFVCAIAHHFLYIVNMKCNFYSNKVSRFAFATTNLRPKRYFVQSENCYNWSRIFFLFLSLFYFHRTINCNMSIHYNRNTVQSIWLKWNYPKLKWVAWRTVTSKGRMRMPTCCLTYVFYSISFIYIKYHNIRIMYYICIFSLSLSTATQ